MDQQDRLVAKARQRIVEEIAIKMLVDSIHEEDGGLELPPSWLNQAREIFDQLLHGIAEESAVERGDFNAKLERDARRSSKPRP